MGRSSDPSIWRPPGRRSTTSSPRDPPRSCPSGLVRDPARRRETLRLPRVRRMNNLLPFDLLCTSFCNIPDWLVEMRANHSAHTTANTCDSPQPPGNLLAAAFVAFSPAVTKLLFFD